MCDLISSYFHYLEKVIFTLISTLLLSRLALKDPKPSNKKNKNDSIETIKVRTRKWGQGTQYVSKDIFKQRVDFLSNTPLLPLHQRSLPSRPHKDSVIPVFSKYVCACWKGNVSVTFWQDCHFECCKLPPQPYNVLHQPLSNGWRIIGNSPSSNRAPCHLILHYVPFS